MLIVVVCFTSDCMLAFDLIHANDVVFEYSIPWFSTFRCKQKGSESCQHNQNHLYLMLVLFLVYLAWCFVIVNCVQTNAKNLYFRR